MRKIRRTGTAVPCRQYSRRSPSGGKDHRLSGSSASGFTLGGTGEGLADDEQEFLGLIHNALALSPVHQVLVEKALKVLKKLNMKSFVILMIRQLRCATWKIWIR